MLFKGGEGLSKMEEGVRNSSGKEYMHLKKEAPIGVGKKCLCFPQQGAPLFYRNGIGISGSNTDLCVLERKSIRVKIESMYLFF